MKPLLAIIVVLLVVAGLWYWLVPTPTSTTPPTTGTSTTPSLTEKIITPQGIAISYASTTYGLALRPDQVLVHSYIPPCEEEFNYCFYRIGKDYVGTNFESAGLRVDIRTTLSTERLCLTTPPPGFSQTTLPTASSTTSTYATSVFGNVGDAGAGHYASGALYRLFVRANNSCTEFATRIGETQYANYPAGTIKQFTDEDRSKVMNELITLLNSVKIASTSTSVAFPPLPLGD